MNTTDEKKRQVWLSVQDADYEDRLCRFLGYHYASCLEVHRYEEYLQGAVPSDNSLLVAEEPLPDDVSVFSRTLRFSEKEEDGAIPLYQSGHKTARQILAEPTPSQARRLLSGSAAEREDLAKKEEKEDCSGCFGSAGRGRVFGVYSPVGGCGKSVFAMALAQCLQQECEGSVLYLPLEGSSAWPLYYRSESAYNLSDLLYCFLMEDVSEAVWNDELERVLTRQENGVYFIRPCTSYQDLSVMTAEETAAFFAALQRRFSWIVCDLDSAFHGVTEQLADCCSRLFLLSRRDVLAEYKLRAFLESLEVHPKSCRRFMDKTRILVRGRGKGEDALPEDKELFKRNEAVLRFNTGSKYYQRIRQLVQEETGDETGGVSEA